MKKLFVVIFAVVLASCSDKPKGFDSKIPTEKEVSDFIRVNPNWSEGDEATTERFKHKMINLSNDPRFLQDMPLKLKQITDSVLSGQEVKLAVFKSFRDANRPKESLQNELDLEIRAIFSLEEATKLHIEQNYSLNGLLYKQGKRGDVKLVSNGESQSYILGKYVFWNVKATPLP